MTGAATTTQARPHSAHGEDRNIKALPDDFPKVADHLEAAPEVLGRRPCRRNWLASGFAWQRRKKARCRFSIPREMTTSPVARSIAQLDVLAHQCSR